ncbi:MAG: cysteine--tRNA ligase [Desulfovibrionales bacterium]
MILYNTIDREKQEFIPLSNNKVKMYACGITAYDYCHIGHARSTVVFDVLVRYLRFLGYELTFVRNFTDVDDKIINKATAENEDPNKIADKFIQAYYQDMDRLDILRADIEPKATEHIQDMIDLTRKLEEKGYAYATDSGNVYFRVRKYTDYGKLSGRNIEELKSGIRVDPGDEKEDPLDFALWKSAKPEEPKWDSPWGAGRPGWHLECSVMSEKYLGLPLDIHGGGQDLAFPHHENERAQSEAAEDKTFARYWVHNGFVRVNQEKMSKSLGNFITIRDILDNFQPETLRFFLLTKHYRSPLDYSTGAMEEAEKGIKRIYSAKQLVERELHKESWKKSPFPEELMDDLVEIENKWRADMDDDLNTAGAIGQIFNLVRLANRVVEDKKLRKSESARDFFMRILADFHSWSQSLGILGSDASSFLTDLKLLQAKRKGLNAARIDSLVSERSEARQAKDFSRADEIRDQLQNMGVAIKDSAGGSSWEIE